MKQDGAIRNCESCGKPMIGTHFKQKWHAQCKLALPGYGAGYNDGRRSKSSGITKSQRQQIAREVVEESKAKIERDIAEKKSRMALIERDIELAECHQRMLNAGFELPEFRFDVPGGKE